ncbi:hypothetical protein CUC44_03230 [Aeromonas lusitana]|uniref:Uncharacterized protein n=1 Tax=Aeromonas lusitana TaxID=931529 RepID=A0A2M8HCQ7_9GAMM|nr:hypothetical protein CUC44_03230 [Aeromonas lusitana]
MGTWVGEADDAVSAPCKGRLHKQIRPTRVLGFIIEISCCSLLSAAEPISLALLPDPGNDKGEPELPL